MSRWLTLALLTGCGGGLSDEQVAQAVEQAFQAANPPGRTGLEFKGKAVWFQAPHFDKSCLENKNLAFNDDPATRPTSSQGTARITPTYEAQRWITASTAEGYCVFLGVDPNLVVDEVSWNADRYRVKTTITMGTPSPWFECLEPNVRNRVTEVKVDAEGNPKLITRADLFQGACPHPLPAGETRTSALRPTKGPDRAPSAEQVRTLARSLDDALYKGDFLTAQSLTACHNLFEDEKFGNCSVAELVSIGPIPRGDPRAQDGTPWHEYVFAGLDDMQATPVRDADDETLFHVPLTHKRTGRDRSFSVQWVGGNRADATWKMVAVVGLQGEGLSSARYMYDLHKADRRDVFERRWAGEQLDEQGNSLVPEGEEEEEEEE